MDCVVNFSSNCANYGHSSTFFNPLRLCFFGRISLTRLQCLLSFLTPKPFSPFLAQHQFSLLTFLTVSHRQPNPPNSTKYHQIFPKSPKSKTLTKPPIPQFSPPPIKSHSPQFFPARPLFTCPRQGSRSRALPTTNSTYPLHLFTPCTSG